MAEKTTEGSQPSRASQAGRPAAQASESKQVGAQQQTGGQQQTGRGAGGLQRRSSFPARATPFAVSPFALMRRMMEDLDRMVEGFGVGRALQPEFSEAGLQRGGMAMWSPAIDVFERDGQFVVRADLPGLSRDDVRIEATDDSLIIEGARRSEMEVEEEGLYRCERSYGRFSRAIPLPEGADPGRAQAKFENGVLEVSVPLSGESTRRRRIEIQGGSAAEGTKPAGSSESAVH
jgi:HSP20 family protein